MIRKLFALAAVLSAVLFAVTVVLLVRSYLTEDSFIVREGMPNECAVSFDRGWVVALLGHVRRSTGRFEVDSPVPFLVAPSHWLAAMIFGIPPVAWLVASRRRRKRDRSALGLCPACGYDLRATPGQCPECGTLPAAKGAATAPARS